MRVVAVGVVCLGRLSLVVAGRPVVLLLVVVRLVAAGLLEGLLFRLLLLRRLLFRSRVAWCCC